MAIAQGARASGARSTAVPARPGAPRTGRGGRGVGRTGAPARAAADHPLGDRQRHGPAQLARDGIRYCPPLLSPRGRAALPPATTRARSAPTRRRSGATSSSSPRCSTVPTSCSQTERSTPIGRTPRRCRCSRASGRSTGSPISRMKYVPARRPPRRASCSRRSPPTCRRSSRTAGASSRTSAQRAHGDAPVAGAPDRHDPDAYRTRPKPDEVELQPAAATRDHVPADRRRSWNGFPSAARAGPHRRRCTRSGQPRRSREARRQDRRSAARSRSSKS